MACARPDECEDAGLTVPVAMVTAALASKVPPLPNRASTAVGVTLMLFLSFNLCIMGKTQRLNPNQGV